VLVDDDPQSHLPDSAQHVSEAENRASNEPTPEVDECLKMPRSPQRAAGLPLWLRRDSE